jgi:hypothetical protein
MRYLAETLTPAQACQSLGVDLAELRQLATDGDVEVTRVEGGMPLIVNATVENLKASPSWKERRP